MTPLIPALDRVLAALGHACVGVSTRRERQKHVPQLAVFFSFDDAPATKTKMNACSEIITFQSSPA